MTGSDSSSRSSRLKIRTPGGRLGAFLAAIAMSVIAGILLTAALTPVVAVGGAAASSAISIFENLPDHLDPGQLAQPSKLYAKDKDGKNKLIAQFYAQNREMVGWDDISQFAKDAAVSEEDPRFYNHSGVDVFAASRAAVGNALGLRLSGASTITMQYVRNVLVQESEMIPNKEERKKAYQNAMRQDIDRKLKEMKLAISVEKQFNKDEILLGYLNIANYGGQVYGIEAAAKRYYNTSAKDLTLAQAASLVAIVNHPSGLRPTTDEGREANKKRRDLILYSMLDEGKITKDQYKEAVDEPVKTDQTLPKAGCQMADGYGLGHFCNYVTLSIMNDPNFGDTQEERWFKFLRGGFNIETTIDLDMQKAAQDAINDRVPQEMQGIDIGSAGVSVEVGTGRVLSMAQNRPFSDNPEFLKSHPTYTSINYSTDSEYGGSKGFQVGSTFKAFTLAEWIKSGHTVREMVQASPRTVSESDFRAQCLGGVYGNGSFSFQNDSNVANGMQSVQKVTSLSVNGGFVSMAQQLDLCDIFDLAQDMGVHRAAKQPNPDLNSYGTRDLTIVPSNVYGGIDEIAPVTMASAYAGFAGDGTVCTPTPIDKITGPKGEKVPITEPTCHQGVSPDVAAGVAHTLEDGTKNGWAKHANSNYGIPHMAKTGTTDNRVDDWTVGASSKVATAVWLGNVTGKQNLSDFGMYRGANPVWPAIMDVADQKYGGDPFPDPKPEALRQKTQAVPDVTGKSLDEAKSILSDAGFAVTEAGDEESDEDKGKVSRTDPKAGEEVPEHSQISVYLSNGKKKDDDDDDEGAKLPDGLVGETAESAASKLNDEGFNNVYMQCKSDKESDAKMRVESVKPKSGERAKSDDRVTLTLGC
jgi:membrane peptidoglycan carboxypeptidase